MIQTIVADYAMVRADLGPEGKVPPAVGCPEDGQDWHD
jgi:hypothetical protein